MVSSGGIDDRHVLPAARRGDEGAAAARAGEDDVARLVADQQRADDARRGRRSTSTTLTLSERWLTTHTSPSVRAATATGSSPTGTEPVWVSPPASTSKISSRLSGVLTAKSRLPLGDSASGRTWPLSKVTKLAAERGPASTPSVISAASIARRLVRMADPPTARAALSTGMFAI